MRFVVTRGRKLWDIMTFAAIWPFTIGHMRSVTFAKRLPHAFNLIKKQKKKLFYCVIIHSGFAISHLHLSRRVWPIVSPLDIDSRTHTQTQCVITIKRQLMFICLFNRGLLNASTQFVINEYILIFWFLRLFVLDRIKRAQACARPGQWQSANDKIDEKDESFYLLLAVCVDYCAAASRPQFRLTISLSWSCFECPPVNCANSAPFDSRNNTKFHCE